MGEKPPKKKEEGPLWHNTKMALGALLAAISFAEMTKAGTSRIDMMPEYERAVADAEQDFLKDPDGCGSVDDLEGDGVCITFNEYLLERNLPTPENMEALQRLIGEFRHPVTFYSGTTLMQKFFEFISRNAGSTARYGHWYPLEIFGHEVFLSNHEGAFSVDDFESTIAELAHAYQAERGDDPLHDLNSAFYVFRSEGYDGAYDDPATAEFQAHGEIEGELTHRLHMLHEHRRSYTARSLRDYMNLPQNLANPQDGVTYERYVTLLEKIQEEVSADNSAFGTEEILRLLEVLPGFTARLEPGPTRSLRLQLEPRREHYDALIEFLGPYTPPDESITELHPLAEDVPGRASVRAFRHYDQERRTLLVRRDYLPQMVAFACPDMQYGDPFTRERYDQMLKVLSEEHYRITREPYYRATMQTQHQIMLLEFINNVWKIDPSVPIGDVIRAPEGGRRGDAEIQGSDAHYEALRRIYETQSSIPGH